MKRSILITGSSGFIGSHLVKELDGSFQVIPYDIKAGYDVLYKETLFDDMRNAAIVGINAIIMLSLAYYPRCRKKWRISGSFS